MAELTLWHVPQSRSMRALWLLHEIGTDFRVRTLDFFDGSMRQPPYVGIHPVGRVPALQDGAVTLHESGAITEWLCETRAPHLTRAPGTSQRAAWLDWLHFGETLGQHLANLSQHHIVLREDWQRSATVMKLEAARLSRALTLIEAGLGDGRDWLLGDFSGVDCQVGWAVWVAARFVRFDTRPVLAGYVARIAARPAFQAALPQPGEALIYDRDFYEVPDAPR
ncbi:glutathione S-transferase family protein [Paracoccus lutimaris]|uniref:Glutathione S-transferase n=1 Tax=Paracoccus lutimaris TaxID=1490030 RepID=A0A368Z2G2_9RHOB|nr:glutathione S-transferase family protein [Paracoccus lutimaris]RCW86635.1 glutathione S-transferase [Paracoccus lutimaris]